MPSCSRAPRTSGGFGRLSRYPHSLIVLEIHDCETVYRELAVRGVESSAR